jgi:hypothetical protein
MKKLIILLLLGLSAPLSAQTIEKIALCRKVENLEPVDLATQFQKGERAYCWLKIANAPKGSFLLLDWYWDGKLQHATRLDLEYSGMRTFGFKTLDHAGQWKVSVRTPDQQVLYELAMDVAGEETPPATAGGTGNGTVVLNPAGTLVTISGSNAGATAGGATARAPWPQGPQQSRLLLPTDYDASKAYPIVVVLPFEDGPASALYSAYLKDMTGFPDDGSSGPNAGFQALMDHVSPMRPFLLLLPGHDATPYDWGNLPALAERCEARIQTDLQEIGQRLPLGRVVLCGYSNGADLAWIMQLRQPRRFAGALLMGSQCGYMEAGALPAMAELGTRIFFFNGLGESPQRKQALVWARWQLDKTGVDYRYAEVPGYGHDAMPLGELYKAIDFLLGGQ